MVENKGERQSKITLSISEQDKIAVKIYAAQNKTTASELLHVWIAEHCNSEAEGENEIDAFSYSARSPIAKAYRAGQMPVDHRRLLDAIKEQLGEGVAEGIIQLEEVLKATGYFRASALKMLRHMQNFGILETESGYRGTRVRLAQPAGRRSRSI